MVTDSAVQVWHNGNIITLDREVPRAAAMVVREGRIDFVGPEADAYARAGSDARRVDLGGRTVVPGFNDNHVHTVILGDHVRSPDLAGLDAAQIVEAIREHYPNPHPGELLIGYAWDYPACPDPHRSILDNAFPNNPVVLPQYGGHGQWLNSAALDAIGVNRGTPDPEHGVILRDPSGEPSGVVRELSTNSLMQRHFLQVHSARGQREERLATALDHFRRLGLTSVQDNTWYVPTVFSLRRLHETGGLSTRFTCWAHGGIPSTIPFMDLPSYDELWVRRGPWKYFLDGTFTTETAWLWEEYADDHGNTGKGMKAPEIAGILSALSRKGVQGAFHAIGDRAISEFLDAYERVLEQFPDLARLRMRLEHAQLIRRADISRLAELGVIVSAQPSALGTPEKDARLLGDERARNAYPYRSLLDAGVKLSFGSDIPGESTCDPLLAIHRVVNRDSPERITVEDALRCYTEGSAYAEFMEEQKGALREGQLADFVVLSEDITSIKTERIKDTQIDVTVVGGRIVYDRNAY